MIGWLLYVSRPPKEGEELRWWRSHARVSFVMLCVDIGAIYSCIVNGNRGLLLVNLALCYVMTRNLTRCVGFIKYLTYQSHTTE